MEKSSAEQKTYHYPWARALMLVVLYGALLVFLWHFPTPGGRAFFQTLFKGFLYVIAGLALVAVTAIFVLFFPLPPMPEKRADGLAGDAYDEDGDYFHSAVVPVRSLMVPTFKSTDVEPRIWEILYTLQRDFEFDYDILADPSTGIVAVVNEDEEEAEYILDEIRSNLKAAGIAVRSPR
jgi:hypothetical protein